MHLKCADVPLSLIADNPLNKYFLFEAQNVKELKKVFLKQSKKPDDAVKDLLTKSKIDTLYHICGPCIKQAGIQKIKMWTRKQVAFISFQNS